MAADVLDKSSPDYWAAYGTGYADGYRDGSAERKDTTGHRGVGSVLLPKAGPEPEPMPEPPKAESNGHAHGPILLSAQEVADSLDVSRSVIYRLAEAGRLDVVRVGGRVLFTPKAVKAFVAQGGSK